MYAVINYNSIKKTLSIIKQTTDNQKREKLNLNDYVRPSRFKATNKSLREKLGSTFNTCIQLMSFLKKKFEVNKIRIGGKHRTVKIKEEYQKGEVLNLTLSNLSIPPSFLYLYNQGWDSAGSNRFG